jgi:hypothetical protein
MSGDIFGVGKLTWLLAIVAAIASGWGYLQVRDMRVVQNERNKVEHATSKAKEAGNSGARKSRVALPNDSGVRVLPEVTD